MSETPKIRKLESNVVASRDGRQRDLFIALCSGTKKPASDCSAWVLRNSDDVILPVFCPTS